MLALGPGDSINTLFISIMLIFLICFTITLEKILHRLAHYLGDAHSPGNQMIAKVSRRKRCKYVERTRPFRPDALTDDYQKKPTPSLAGEGRADVDGSDLVHCVDGAGVLPRQPRVYGT